MIKNLWMYTTCMVLILVATIGLTLFVRIALLANAALIIFDIVQKVWVKKHG